MKIFFVFLFVFFAVSTYCVPVTPDILHLERKIISLKQNPSPHHKKLIKILHNKITQLQKNQSFDFISPLRHYQVLKQFNAEETKKFRIKLHSHGVVIGDTDEHDVLATHSGIILYAGPIDSLEQGVIIEGQQKQLSLIAQIKDLQVVAGDVVNQGDMIAKTTLNKKTENYSLYWELRHRDKLINPLKKLEQNLDQAHVFQSTSQSSHSIQKVTTEVQPLSASSSHQEME